MSTLPDLTKDHLFGLAARHRSALREEDYGTCKAVKDEIDRRVQEGLIDDNLMQGFRNFDPASQQFYGPPKDEYLNGLFSEYWKQNPHKLA